MFFSLKNRLIAFIVVLFLLSFSTLSILLYTESRTLIRSYIESSALEKMEEYGSYIDMVQMQIYDAASLVFNSDATREWNETLSRHDLSSGDQMLANLDMSRFLTHANNSYTSISDIAIYGRNGLRVGGENAVGTDPAYTREEWFVRFFHSGQQWVASHQEQNGLTGNESRSFVSLLLPIGSFDPASARSVMKVNVDEAFFLEPLNRIHLAQNSTIYLLDDQGLPLLSQQAHRLGERAAAEIDDIRSSPSKSGVRYVTNDDGKQDILVYKKLGRTGWMLAGLAPEQELYQPLHKLQNTTLLVTALLISVALVAAAWLSHGFTKPLSRLVQAMKKVQRGAFDQAEAMLPPERNVKSEVSYVISTFRYMVNRLQQHIHNEFELKLLRQQAEYKALLMQINPHFMFNTLELVSSLAMQGRTDETVSVIEDLGKMMRYSMHPRDDRAALVDELAYVRRYLSILETRFGPKLDISLTEEGDLEPLIIIKFVLQPLVENAVKYSFRHQTLAKVRIHVARHDHKLVLSVSDNGPGMPSEVIKQLNEPATGSQLERILQSESWHIGLGNVVARCRLHYGESFALRVQSVEGNGTRIELILPIQEGYDVPRINRG